MRLALSWTLSTCSCRPLQSSPPSLSSLKVYSSHHCTVCSSASLKVFLSHHCLFSSSSRTKGGADAGSQLYCFTVILNSNKGGTKLEILVTCAKKPVSSKGTYAARHQDCVPQEFRSGQLLVPSTPWELETLVLLSTEEPQGTSAPRQKRWSRRQRAPQSS